MSNPQAPPTRALLVGAFATLALFAAHHAYGAVLYRTPWRHHAAFVAAAVGAVLLIADGVYRRKPVTAARRVAGWTLVALALLVLGAVIGLFEGVYNHVLKDVLFLAGAPQSLLLRLFPPPRYELPDDLLFELSGVLQAVAAAFAVRSTVRFARALRRRPGPVPGAGVGGGDGWRQTATP